MHYIQFIYSSVNGGFIKHVNIYDNQNQANTCNCIAIIWFDLQCCITLFAGEYSKKYLGSGHDIPNSASNIPGKIQTSEFYLPDMTMEMVITMRLTDKVCLYPSTRYLQRGLLSGRAFAISIYYSYTWRIRHLRM